MKDTLTAEKLEEIEARANTATPGPWEQTDGNIWIDTRECVCCGRGSIHGCCGEPDVVGGQELIGTSNPVDAEFMAHARTDIPALLAHAKAQAAEIERLTKERDAYKFRGDNHAETLRGITRMNPASEGERMVLWARDGLSGYVRSADETLKDFQDRATAAEAKVSALTEAFNRAIELCKVRGVSSCERGAFK